jgi:hypothetical protein
MKLPLGGLVDRVLGTAAWLAESWDEVGATQDSRRISCVGNPGFEAENPAGNAAEQDFRQLLAPARR